MRHARAIPLPTQETKRIFMGKDLGKYHMRVEFEDGTGFIMEVDTGWRYTHGRSECHPLKADKITPTWDDEESLFETEVYIFTEGNFSCDCNKRSFLCDAAQAEEFNDDCGDTIKIKSITAIRPDMSEVVIFPK